MPRVVALLLLALPATPGLRAAAAPATDLATGIRQVQEGDFENAVLTLQAVTRALGGQTARRLELAQAWLYLGIAHVALDQTDGARAAFKAAIGQNRSLRLSEERFSPKVIAAFEAARREAEAAAGAPDPGEASRGKPLLWVALGGAAAGAVVLATREGGGGGNVMLGGARFATPVIVCPDGSVDVMLPFGVLVDATNDTGASLDVQSVSTVAVITASSEAPSEVGFSSNLPSRVAPMTVAAHTRATLRVDTSLLCGNGAGGPARSNQWLARLSFTTSAGTFNVETTDRLRIDLP
jgi:hypothetical protein